MLKQLSTLLAALVCLSPAVCVAQPRTMPTPHPGPMLPPLPGMPMPMPMGPRGQADPHSGGISVNGIGQLSAAADVARVTLNLAARNNQLTLNKTTLQPVVDALVRAHVDPASIVEPIYLQGAASSNYATVGGTVNQPTVPMLQDALQTLTSAFAAMPDILVNQASVMVSISDCTALRSNARRAALQQAHAQALEIANASGVHLGKILAVQAYGDSGGGAGQSINSCSSYYQIGPGNMPSFQSLADYLQVRVGSNVNVTYAIR